MCSKKEIRLCFEDIENIDVIFGLRDQFKFDSRCYNRPKIHGIVVANVSVNRQLEPTLYLFSINHELITEEIRTEFIIKIMERIKSWIKELILKNETEILGYETLVIELHNKNFIEHKLRYL